VLVAEGPDRRVAQIAAAQHGIVTRAQLLGAGMSSGAIAHRLAHGRLHRMHRGVYLLGHRIAPPLAWETAAVLAYGARAALSHRTAGNLWGLLPEGGELVHVTVVGEGKGRSGIRIHRARSLESRDLARRHGLSLTSPARTLFDLSEALSPRELERDRLRDAELLGAGLAVLRVTWDQIVAEPEALLVRLAQALDRPRQRLSSAQWQ
jgi:hypothetical protein